ncbi:hypothetical protein [Lactiplantibacillus daowaiensis]|uniref:Phage protein n=1 Tax=Lactiplantibacillus daowaiensis TaxID=2559918 RepID=A0ABW1RY40_9LACO|nr:hypothetical protein [Lactiplantibacillus daowaiensis]
MKLSELESAITASSLQWTIDNSGTFLTIGDPMHDGYPYAKLRLKGVYYEIANLLPSLARNIIEFMATPISQRVISVKKWNVVIGADTDDPDYISVYCKGEHEGDFNVDAAAIECDLTCDRSCQFTDKEFKDLISALKKQPHGDVLAKIAELGKREVECDE